MFIAAHTEYSDLTFPGLVEYLPSSKVGNTKVFNLRIRIVSWSNLLSSLGLIFRFPEMRLPLGMCCSEIAMKIVGEKKVLIVNHNTVNMNMMKWICNERNLSHRSWIWYITSCPPTWIAFWLVFCTKYFFGFDSLWSILATFYHYFFMKIWCQCCINDLFTQCFKSFSMTQHSGLNIHNSWDSCLCWVPSF